MGRQGTDRHGRVWRGSRGMVRCGLVRPVEARTGRACHGRIGTVSHGTQGTAGLGKEGHGITTIQITY